MVSNKVERGRREGRENVERGWREGREMSERGSTEVRERVTRGQRGWRDVGEVGDVVGELVHGDRCAHKHWGWGWLP